MTEIPQRCHSTARQCLLLHKELNNLMMADGDVCCRRHFVSSVDVAGLPVDVALRKFQSLFRLPVSLAVWIVML